MELQCPTSPERVNERVVRLVAGQVAALSLAQLIFPNLLIPTLLLADFALRAGGREGLSPLAWLARRVDSFFSAPAPLTDKAPKRFAAACGFAFSALLLFSFAGGAHSSAWGIAAVLVLFATLESVFGFCVGCQVYTLWVWLLPRLRTSRP